MKHGFSIVGHWFSFMGRMGRGDYNGVNMVALVLILSANFIFVLPLFTMEITGPISLASIPLGWNAWIAGVIMTVALWIAVSSTVRRLHDFGWSGWWLVLCLAPLHNFAVAVGLMGMMILAIFPGKRAANAYGERTPPNQFV